MKHFVTLGLILCLATLAAADENILAGLRKEHPRLILTAEAEARMTELLKTDKVLQQFRDIIIAHADSILDEGEVEHKKIGRRLLSQSRNMLRRVLYTSAAYRLTREARYLQRAEKEMLAAAALPDWNPSHFLDVGEMAAGMGFGYDWLYSDLTEHTRAAIRQAVIEKAFEPSGTGRNWWIRAKNNWGPVCHGGLTVAALAIAEDEPDWATNIVARAVPRVRDAMLHSCEPDGAYLEGGGYWGYGTSFNVMFISALESALGTDFGLKQHDSFLQSAFYRLLSMGPDGGFFNYGDCGFKAVGLTPSLHWFAGSYDEPGLAKLIRNMEAPVLKEQVDKPGRDCGRLLPLVLAWYSGPGHADAPLPLDRFYDGANPVAFFRSGWDRDALWLGFKGGNNENPHCHMDAGEFVVVAGGVRWAHAYGGDNYTRLEAIASKHKGSLWRPPMRFKFFRYGVRGHSVLMINSTNQLPRDSASPIIAYRTSETRSHAIVDMSRPWREQAQSVKRGAAMLDRTSVLIQDEVTGAKGDITWQMIVRKGVELDGSKAVLKRDGTSFIVRILAPADARFETLSTSPDFEGENSNSWSTRLAFRVPPGTNITTLAVQMWLKSGPAPATPQLRPLSEWAGHRKQEAGVTSQD